MATESVEISNGNLANYEVLTDLVSGKQCQIFKLSLGVDGNGDPVEGSIPVRFSSPSSSAVTSVASSASNVTLLASNANRRGATIFNDSSAILYVKLGATASTSSFTAKLIQDAYYEVPFGYTGIIDGIWASATGNARITEIS